MAGPNPIVFLVLHAIFFVTGLTANNFILLVHFLDWLKTHEINPCDLIINSIGISNIFLQGIVAVNEYCFYLFTAFYAQDWILKSFVTILASLTFSSLWFCTCLCFYYFVKLINLKGNFFYRLKTNIPKRVPWLLVGSILISLAAGLPSYWDLTLDHSASIYANMSMNKTSAVGLNIKSRCECLFHIYMGLSAVAFTIISFTVVAILTSLFKHMKRMQSNNEGPGGIKITSHLAAAKTVTSLLILYLTFYGALNVIFNEPSAAGTMFFSVCFVVVSSFPTVNAIILITGNRKLANVLKEILGIKSSNSNEVTTTS